ncbi:MAG: hypothetical protein JWN70_4797 [Planctomycetaceae bacterium]|nr:hypothetical protein [Planctomycetaceae bacterium]
MRATKQAGWVRYIRPGRVGEFKASVGWPPPAVVLFLVGPPNATPLAGTTGASPVADGYRAARGLNWREDGRGGRPTGKEDRYFGREEQCACPSKECKNARRGRVRPGSGPRFLEIGGLKSGWLSLTDNRQFRKIVDPTPQLYAL